MSTYRVRVVSPDFPGETLRVLNSHAAALDWIEETQVAYEYPYGVTIQGPKGFDHDGNGNWEEYQTIWEEEPA